MAKLSSLKQSATQRVLIYGPPKTGKTELAMRLAEAMDVLYIGMENGHSTGLKLPAEWQDRINVINLPDTRDNPIAIETALKLSKGTPTNVCEAHGKVDCALCKKDPTALWNLLELAKLPPTTVVVWDSLTQLTNSAVAKITQGKADDYKLDYDDWRYLGILMDQFLVRIQQATYNTVCISHESEVKMEDGKMRLVPTAGTSNFSRNTAKYFDHVVYAEVSMKKHKFMSSSVSHMQAIAGSRTDIVLEKTEAPSLLDIFRKTVLSVPSTSVKSSAVLTEKENGQTSNTSYGEQISGGSEKYTASVKVEKLDTSSDKKEVSAASSEVQETETSTKIATGVDPVSGLEIKTKAEVDSLPVMGRLKYLKAKDTAIVG